MEDLISNSNQFYFFQDKDKERVMHSKSYNKEIMMKSIELVFNDVNLWYIIKNVKRGGSYIDSSDWIKNKKATINPIDKKDNKCFQYAVTVVLNHEEARKDPQRITNIKPFRNKYNRKQIFLSEKIDCKTLEKNNLTVAINLKNTVIFIVRIAFNLLQKITNMNLIKNYVKRKIFVTF